MKYINLFLKRIIDIIFSLIGIIVTIPIFIIIPILIKIDSKGPVFFKQERRTKNGKIFKMLKFRTMAVNAEKMGTGLFNYKNDPRVTKIGRFLRNTSIDEIPQLFNILFGSMSFVGPRPCVKYELGDFDTLNKTYKKRFEVKAGLTGLAQVEGRNDISWSDKIKYDNIYVDKFNKYGILYDIKIMFETILSVLKKENIYENKINTNLSDEESAKEEEKEIIRLAHIKEDKNEIQSRRKKNMVKRRNTKRK